MVEVAQGANYSYDAGAHQFFADHYLRSPFGLHEPRWFGGFSVSSYPPLAHQLVAAVGAITGVEIAFGVVLLATLVLMPVAVNAFARMFVADGPAHAAAIVSERGRMAVDHGHDAAVTRQRRQQFFDMAEILDTTAVAPQIPRGGPSRRPRSWAASAWISSVSTGAV